LKIAVIPDVQVKPGNDFTFLKSIGNYLVEKKPDIIVCLGDFADMPSLSSYDVGKKSFEGRRYKDDIQATHDAMEALLLPIKVYNEKARANHKERYVPRRILTLGNHENRIDRAVENDAKLDGVLSVKDLKYEEYGWEVYPFLDVVVINSIAFSHYFTTGVMGRPCTSAQMMLTKKHMSCVAGHQQGLQFATSYRADGHRLTSIIAGSCYEHNEDYMGPQGNHHYRGIVMLNDVTSDGEFDLMPVSLRFLKERYAE
jgi:Calcineurin-like phosphoesterase